MSHPLEDTVVGLEDGGLEDEVGALDDRKKVHATLFGESDSEDDEAPPAENSTLAALAARKRKEIQEKEQQEEAERRRKRARQGPAPALELAGADEGRDASEDEGAEAVATAEDDAFIDDEGQPAEPEAPQADSESDEEAARGAGLAPDEAEEEEDEFEAMFASKGRKRGPRGSALKSKGDVDSFMGMMEAAALTDLDANREGRPAVHKLKMLAEAEDMLSRRDLHNTFLDGGLLGVLKAWLEPMPDGSLPNERVRSAVLRVLQQLPVDVADEGRKDQLKRSGIGKVVLFLYKLPDETAANRRAAKALVEKWSRPIFDQYRERRDTSEANERELQLLQARRRREQGKGAAAGEQEGAQKPRRPGDPGFRWHASIPDPARLDYVRRPESQAGARKGCGDLLAYYCAEVVVPDCRAARASPSCRENMLTLLRSEAAAAALELEEDLAAAQFVTLALDGWSDIGNNSVVAFLAHFGDGRQRLVEKLGPEKVLALVTDNARDMGKHGRSNREAILDRDFWADLAKLVSVLTPASQVIMAIQSTTASLAEVYRYLLYLASCVGQLPPRLPPEYKEHVQRKFLERWREMDNKYCRLQAQLQD
ncbi:hypothetical protein WJX81_002979 [Elliptochloris bilobata]|uniref:TFIIS N-terminal domain-containing protein n=1 Tax=Elliptochloris bilobata TaxID=381761 RepID=A0AAW1RK36_9CHLO